MKIKIAGAGISGMTAAINLAKAGYEVEIYEAKAKVGSRFAGDLQGIENWSSKKDALEEIQSYGIDINFDYSPAVKNLEVWTLDEKLKLSLDVPGYYLVRRGSFESSIDFSIYRQTQKLQNIKIFFDKPVTNPEGFNVIATGPVFENKNADYMAYGYTFETNLEDSGILLLDDNLAPDGYGYFLVMYKYAVIASCIMKDFKNLVSYAEKTFEYFKKNRDFNIVGKIQKFSGLGNFFLVNPPNKKHLYVGEAGGFQDFALGFGMKYAIKSGYLAARSIIENVDYYDLVQNELHKAMKASISNRFLYKFLTRKSYGYMIKEMRSLGLRRILNDIYSPKWWHKLVYPIASLYYRKNIKEPMNLN